MNINELKRGMKITFRNGFEYIVKSYDGRTLRFFDGSSCSDFNLDLSHRHDREGDIVKVEDLDENGNYQEIYKRATNKYHLKPVGINLVGDVFVYNTITNKWFNGPREEYGNYRTKFTFREMEELGVEVKYFLLELVE